LVLCQGFLAQNLGDAVRGEHFQIWVKWRVGKMRAFEQKK